MIWFHCHCTLQQRTHAQGGNLKHRLAAGSVEQLLQYSVRLRSTTLSLHPAPSAHAPLPALAKLAH